jgi:hypothetical protein
VVILSGASGNTIGGITTTPGTGLGDVISGNSSDGVELNGSVDNVVEGDLIGTDKTGTNPLLNTTGIYVAGDTGSKIGGQTAYRHQHHGECAHPPG